MSFYPFLLKHSVNSWTFLRQRYAVVKPASQSSDIDLMNDNFIGMWSDRQDLADSTTWVRSVRENEWSKSHD